MPQTGGSYASLQEWITRDALPFSREPGDALNAAIDRMIGLLGPVQLLALGEATHGVEGIWQFRNRLFQRLVEKHGFCAIAMESSFPRGRVVDEFVQRKGDSYEAIADKGFSHNFGPIAANRELIEWMRRYNSEPLHPTKLRFYGFDSPTEMTGTDSPRALLNVALDYLRSIDAITGDRRERLEAHLGNDSDWENPAAMMDPGKSIGLSPAATALRIETDDLEAEMRSRAPELIAKTDADRFSEAVHHLRHARQMLTYHAGLARPSPNRTADLLGLRDLMMADNLSYIIDRERPRGKVFAFAHNSHLKRGPAEWQLGPQLLRWWPAGAHMGLRLGESYAVIGEGIGVLESSGIGQPEPGTLEASLMSAGSGRFITTRAARILPGQIVSALPKRSGSPTNYSYFPYSSQSLTDFDALLMLS